MEKLRLNKNETLTILDSHFNVLATPAQAIKFLLKVKEIHKENPHYNHFLVCNLLDEALFQKTIKLCENYNLKYFIITTKNFNMSGFFKTDNKYDVVFNKVEDLGSFMTIVQIYSADEK